MTMLHAVMFPSNLQNNNEISILFSRPMDLSKGNNHYAGFVFISVSLHSLYPLICQHPQISYQSPKKFNFPQNRTLTKGSHFVRRSFSEGEPYPTAHFFTA